ncbi:Ribonuclease R [Streptomyces narbonensis]
MDELQLPEKDATRLPLFTIDPPESRDLDQAMHLERRPGGGYRVYYAIADVAAFVKAGSALDAEAHDRIETLYFPDLKVPLYPPLISEGPASLLPGQVVPALLWQHDLDAEGNVTGSHVSRAKVSSQAKLSYAEVQRKIDAGTAAEPVALLREIGKLREAVEAKRHGVSVNLPDQEVTVTDGIFRLGYVATLPVEGWNEQISLMTGMAAARIMLDSGTGILRTQKEQDDPRVIQRVHDIAELLGIEWKSGVLYADLVNSLNPADRKHMAFLNEATAMLLKAEYTNFRDHQIPKHTLHAAIAAPYTYCTAPLRRLIDRYTGELCVAACAGQAPPEWVLDAMYCLPCDMARGEGEGGGPARGGPRGGRGAEAPGERGLRRHGHQHRRGGRQAQGRHGAPCGTRRDGQDHVRSAARPERGVQAKLTRADPLFPSKNKILFRTVAMQASDTTLGKQRAESGACAVGVRTGSEVGDPQQSACPRAVSARSPVRRPARHGCRRGHGRGPRRRVPRVGLARRRTSAPRRSGRAGWAVASPPRAAGEDPGGRFSSSAATWPRWRAVTVAARPSATGPFRARRPMKTSTSSRSCAAMRPRKTPSSCGSSKARPVWVGVGPPTRTVLSRRVCGRRRSSTLHAHSSPPTTTALAWARRARSSSRWPSRTQVRCQVATGTLWRSRSPGVTSWTWASCQSPPPAPTHPWVSAVGRPP